MQPAIQGSKLGGDPSRCTLDLCFLGAVTVLPLQLGFKQWYFCFSVLDLLAVSIARYLDLGFSLLLSIMFFIIIY